MTKTILLIIAWLCFSACTQNARSSRDSGTDIRQASASANLRTLFTISEAEKILGQPAFLSDSTSKQNPGVVMYQCAYTVKVTGSKSEKTAAVYFLAEDYTETAAAQKKYTSIKTANERHEGIKVLSGLGDEAYFHSDNENFYFIMVRKGNHVFSMKVNKITQYTSLDAFNQVAAQIANRL